MDKTASLATADDLILDSTHPADSVSQGGPRTVYSLAVTLSSPPPGMSNELPTTPDDAPPAARTLSLLGQLESNQQPPPGLSTESEPSGASGSSESGRYGPVTVDWVDFAPAVPTTSSSDPGGATTSNTASDLPKAFGGSRPNSDDGHPSAESLIARSGSTHLPSGTVHLYRHTTSTPHTTASVEVDPTPRSSLSFDVPSSASSSPAPSSDLLPASADPSDGRLVCVLAVPAYFTPADFLAYVGRAEGEMECLRMIRDVSPSRSLVLIRFRTADAAEEFIEDFDGRLFSSFEPERCHVVRILHVLAHFVPPPGSTAASTSAPETPSPVETTPFEEDRLMVDALGGAYELPSCPVCLERLDASISGLVTVQCDHVYHCACLARWKDSRCPVCRYSQMATTSSTNPPPGLPHPPAHAPSSCAAPGCTITDSLWICLICGIVGCGRYSDGKHAQRHFESTGHIYALELETQRVWDYCADAYVHRLLLLQSNKASGQESSDVAASSTPAPSPRPPRDPSAGPRSTLVELPPATSTAPTTAPHHPSFPPSTLNHHRHPHPPSEKLEALSLEYSHLLTSQLSAQRTYFTTLQTSLESRVAELELALALSRSAPPLPTPPAPKPAPPSEPSLKARVKSLERELASERMISSSLVEKLRSVNEGKVKDLERELGAEREKRVEKEEEVRDLMFFLEARGKIEEAEAKGAAGEGGEGEGTGGGGVMGELAGGTVGGGGASGEGGESVRRRREEEEEERGQEVGEISLRLCFLV